MLKNSQGTNRPFTFLTKKQPYYSVTDKVSPYAIVHFEKKMPIPRTDLESAQTSNNPARKSIDEHLSSWLRYSFTKRFVTMPDSVTMRTIYKPGGHALTSSIVE